MDLLSLVQWIGCVAALCGAVVVLWLPEDEALTRRRIGALVVAGVVVALAVARWSVLDDTEADAAAGVTALIGQVGIASLVVLALLLGTSSATSRSTRRVHRRAAGALCGGFAVALSATLQINLVGETWNQTQWVLVAGQVLGCVALVLGQAEVADDGVGLESPATN